MSDAARENPGREATDASPRVIGVVAAALAAGVASALLIAALLFSAGRATRTGAPSLEGAGLFQHCSREQTDIERDWAQIDADTRRNLRTYGWIDRKAGVVRIPIERAMELMAARRP